MLPGASAPDATRLAIATSLNAKQEAIVDRIVIRLRERIPVLDQVPSPQDLLRESVAGNVSTFLQLLSNEGIDSESLQAPVAAVEYATRIAQHEVPVSALNRAYHLGQNELLRFTIDEIDELNIPGSQKLEIIRYASERIDLYSDWILQRVIEIYAVEKRRWWSNRASLNAAIIRRVLRGGSVTSEQFFTQTRYCLDSYHLGIIAWFQDGHGVTDQQRNVDGLFQRLAGILRSGCPPLTTAADGLTAWAWIALSGPTLTSKMRHAIEHAAEGTPGVRLALGVPSQRGSEGFVRSHKQAVMAQTLAINAPTHFSSTVVASSDPWVGLTAIFLKDRDLTKLWVHQVLGEFAGQGEPSRLVRQTMAKYYATDGNSSRTAELLGIHRNTVKRRVALFEKASSGFHNPNSATEIALALRMHDILGLPDGDFA
jgi:hypothetical protein